MTAPWSAYGYTLDGFAKPELSAPGRYMVGPVPVTSTLYSERADHIVDPGYVELSGTSFSAPIVSGIAALILGKHPEYTPNQVKGALMLGAKPMPAAVRLSAGVGEVNAGRSLGLAATPPNPNKALSAFVSTDSGDRRARLRRRQLGSQGEERCLLGGGLLGRRLLGRRLLVGGELG